MDHTEGKPEFLAPADGVATLQLNTEAVTALYESINKQANSITKGKTQQILNPDTATYDEVVGVIEIYASMPQHPDQRNPETAVADGIDLVLGYLATSPTERRAAGGRRSGSKEQVDPAETKARKARNQALLRVIGALAKELVFIDSYPGLNKFEQPRPEPLARFKGRLAKLGVPEEQLAFRTRHEVEALVGKYREYLDAKSSDGSGQRAELVKNYLLGEKLSYSSEKERGEIFRVLGEVAPRDITEMLVGVRPQSRSHKPEGVLRTTLDPRLREEMIEYIRLLASGMTQAEASKRAGIHRQTAQSRLPIMNAEPDLPKDVVTWLAGHEIRSYRRYTADEVTRARALHESGMPLRQIAEEMGLGHHYIVEGLISGRIKPRVSPSREARPIASRRPAPRRVRPPQTPKPRGTFELPERPPASDADALRLWGVLFSYKVGRSQGNDVTGIQRVLRGGFGASNAKEARALVKQAKVRFGII